ncbi:MAG: ArsR family transcriptional regulator [Candidatus Thermoplasmatota archaeon]|jgi:predicted transcriptional regulator|nr:ArsR family transcriptional regulator [Candidatus Thermoplasmatota archaeon]
MAKGQYYRLNPQDEKIVKIFTDLGMPKNLAKTLMYISQTEECRSADIEHGANLRQPEVSVAMQVLQEKGWITKRDLKKKGKGRPVHLYKLTSPIHEIIKNFEKEKLKEIDHIKNDLEELKNLIGTR